jgi:isoquinoline 1-oxidoreductase subunit alpha
MQRNISFTLNGKPVELTVDDDRMLLWVLRYDLRLTGTRLGCGEALCGSCTVIVGQDAMRSCLTPVKEVAGKRVLTRERFDFYTIQSFPGLGTIPQPVLPKA